MNTTSADHGTPVTLTPEQVENVGRNARREWLRLELAAWPDAVKSRLIERMHRTPLRELIDILVDYAPDAEIDALYRSIADDDKA